MKPARIVFLLTLAVLLVVAVPAGAQQNLLYNPSFEPPYINGDYAAGWVPWNASAGVAVDFYQEVFGSLRSGSGTQALLAYYATYTAGLYQQVTVGRAGVPLNASVWGRVFVALSPGDNKGSRQRIGIDPAGGTNPFAPGIFWSPEISNSSNYELMSVSAVSTGPTVTVFLYGTQNVAAAEHRQYWDDATLSVLGAPGVAPTPQPGQPSAGAGNGSFITPTAQVNIRSGPGTSFPRLAIANPGESFPMLGQQGEWYQINYNGVVAYISSRFSQVIAAGQPPAAIAGPSFSANFTVRVRGGPGTSFPIVTRLAPRGIAQLIGRNADASWLQVRVGTLTGWVLRTLGTVTGDINALPVTG